MMFVVVSSFGGDDENDHRMRVHLGAVAVAAKKITTTPRPPNDGCKAPPRPSTPSTLCLLTEHAARPFRASPLRHRWSV